MSRPGTPPLRSLLAPLFLAGAVMLGTPVVALAAPTQLTVWHAYRGEERAALERALALFADRSGGHYTVKAVPAPYDSFADKISAAVPTGTGPDLFIFSHDRLGGWIEAGGVIEPIDFYLDAELGDRFLPETLDAMDYRGQTFGLPFKFAVIAMVYNKAKVPNPPETTGELETWAKANTDPGSGRYGFAYLYNDFFLHAALMNGFGGHVFDPEKAGILVDPTLDIEPNIRAADLMLKWLRTDRILPSEPSGALITSLFNDGRTDIVFSGPWFLGEVNPKMEVGIRPLPRIDEAGGEPLRPWMTVEGLYVSAQSQHKDAAFELARFLTTEEIAEIMALQGRQLPANRHVYDNPKVAADPILTGFRAQAETAVPMPNIAVMTLMWSPMDLALNKMLKGAATPAQALGEVQERLAADINALRKNR